MPDQAQVTKGQPITPNTNTFDVFVLLYVEAQVLSPTMKRGCVGSCRGRSGFLSRAGASSVGRRRSCLGACRSSGSWWCPVVSQGVSWPCAAPSCRQTPFGAVCRPTGARVAAGPPSRPCRPSPVWGGCAVCSRPDLIHERVSEPGSELQHLLQLCPAGGRSTKRVRPELSGKVSVLTTCWLW